MIRRAVAADLEAVVGIYNAVLDREESGVSSVGWLRGVYPTEETAGQALVRGDLYVSDRNGRILGAGVIDQRQVDVYAGASWEYQATDSQVCVLHTLVIDPAESGKGLGREFVLYYEEYAARHRWPELRIDTNEKNLVARAMYRRLGYREIATVPTVFHAIPDVHLVLLEKNLGAWADAKKGGRLPDR